MQIKITAVIYHFLHCLTETSFDISVQHRFGERSLVLPVKTEEEQSIAGEESAMESTDAMFESLSLETQEKPSSSKSVMKSFQTGSMKKKKKLKKKK